VKHRKEGAFLESVKGLLRKKGSHASTSSTTPLKTELLIPVPAATTTMAQKSLREFSVPAVANMPTGPAVNIGDKNFEIRTGLITVV
jgi:hypothetical protein